MIVLPVAGLRNNRAWRRAAPSRLNPMFDLVVGVHGSQACCSPPGRASWSLWGCNCCRRWATAANPLLSASTHAPQHPEVLAQVLGACVWDATSVSVGAPIRHLPPAAGLQPICLLGPCVLQHTRRSLLSGAALGPFDAVIRTLTSARQAAACASALSAVVVLEVRAPIGPRRWGPWRTHPNTFLLSPN